MKVAAQQFNKAGGAQASSGLRKAAVPGGRTQITQWRRAEQRGGASTRCGRRSALAAVAEAGPAEALSSANSSTETAEYYALVCSASFMLHDVQNEALAEQLRERRRLYDEKGKALDFCIVSEPSWLEREFPGEAARVRRPCVALVSSDKTWITFMKLRLDRVLKLDLGRRTAESAFSSSAPVPDFPPLDKSKWTAPYAPYRPGWWKAFEPEAVLRK